MTRDSRFTPDPFCTKGHVHHNGRRTSNRKLLQQQASSGAVGGAAASSGHGSGTGTGSELSDADPERGGGSGSSSPPPLGSSVTSSTTAGGGGVSPTRLRPHPSTRTLRSPNGPGSLPVNFWDAQAWSDFLFDWKTRYLFYLDLRIGDRSGGLLTRWAITFMRFFFLGVWRPIYRWFVPAGLAPHLHASAAADAAAQRCIAYRLIASYKATRRVIMYGRTRKHQWISQRHSSGAGSLRGTWKVGKSNPLRVIKRRILTIVQEGSSQFVLYNYDAGADRRLRRRLLLTQIVQADASVTEPRRVLLYIEARHHPPAGRSSMTSDTFLRFDVPADSTYDLLFDSEGDREAFLGVLLQCRREMQEALAKKMMLAGVAGTGHGAGAGAASGGGGGSSAAAAAGRAGGGHRASLNASGAHNSGSSVGQARSFTPSLAQAVHAATMRGGATAGAGLLMVSAPNSARASDNEAGAGDEGDGGAGGGGGDVIMSAADDYTGLEPDDGGDSSPQQQQQQQQSIGGGRPRKHSQLSQLLGAVPATASAGNSSNSSGSAGAGAPASSSSSSSLRGIAATATAGSVLANRGGHSVRAIGSSSSSSSAGGGGGGGGGKTSFPGIAARLSLGAAVATAQLQASPQQGGASSPDGDR